MDKQTNKVSVLILTMNEEVNIRACLEGVKWADDIVVLDSGSTDATLQVVREYTDRVYERKFDNWAAHLDWALEKIPFKHHWLVNVDADEIVTPPLADEMVRVAEEDPQGVTAYWVRRRFIFLGKWLKYSALYKTWILRMFRHEKVRFQRLVNPVPVYEGGDAHFQSDLIHDDRKGFVALVARHNSYSTYEATESFRKLYPEYLTDEERSSTLQDDSAVKKKKRIFEKLPLILRPPVRFSYMYFGNLGFLDGVPGFIYSFFKMCYEFFICVKIYELKLNRLPGKQKQ